MSILYSKILVLVALILFSFSNCQKKEKVDSLRIEVSLDPGSGPDYYFINIHFERKDFNIEYVFYDGFDRAGYNSDPKAIKLGEKYRATKNKDSAESYLEKIRAIRESYVKYYKKNIKLKKRKYKEYLAELNKISNLSDKEIEREKIKGRVYIHGIGSSFHFYKKSKINELYAFSLAKDNYKTLYHFLVNTLDLYRKQNQDAKFNKKTFGY